MSKSYSRLPPLTAEAQPLLSCLSHTLPSESLTSLPPCFPPPQADAQLQHGFQDTLTLQGVPYMENNTEPGWWHGGLPLPEDWQDTV
jgi:hypothetical protein